MRCGSCVAVTDAQRPLLRRSMRGQFEAMIRAAQNSITGAVEELDGATFREDAWTRPGGGGGISRVLQARPQHLPLLLWTKQRSVTATVNLLIGAKFCYHDRMRYTAWCSRCLSCAHTWWGQPWRLQRLVPLAAARWARLLPPGDACASAAVSSCSEPAAARVLQRCSASAPARKLDVGAQG